MTDQNKSPADVEGKKYFLGEDDFQMWIFYAFSIYLAKDNASLRNLFSLNFWVCKGEMYFLYGQKFRLHLCTQTRQYLRRTNIFDEGRIC